MSKRVPLTKMAINSVQQSSAEKKTLVLNRRAVLSFGFMAGSVLLLKSKLSFAATSAAPRTQNIIPTWPKNPPTITKIILSDKTWRTRLTTQAYDVLRREGTERPNSSIYEHEKRAGEYLCAGCGLLLFTSDKKYDSGTGWPSFSQAVGKHMETKRDVKFFVVRTEYHCKRCGGHQGHVFNDGPAPTFQRWCNNGVALRFVAYKT